MTNEKHEINDGHIHEALDRLHVAQEYLDSLVGGHALFSAIPLFNGQVQDAIKILGALYQEIGSHETISEIFATYEVNEDYVELR